MSDNLKGNLTLTVSDGEKVFIAGDRDMWVQYNRSPGGPKNVQFTFNCPGHTVLREKLLNKIDAGLVGAQLRGVGQEQPQ